MGMSAVRSDCQSQKLIKADPPFCLINNNYNNIYFNNNILIIIIIIFIYTVQIQRTFSNAPYKNSKSFTILKSNLQFFHQIKSNQIKCWFLRRGENRSTRRKTSRSRVENQQTQPTYDAKSGNRTRDTLVEGERSHHCANPITNWITILQEILLKEQPNIYWLAQLIEHRTTMREVGFWKPTQTNTNGWGDEAT